MLLGATNCLYLNTRASWPTPDRTLFRVSRNWTTSARLIYHEYGDGVRAIIIGDGRVNENDKFNSRRRAQIINGNETNRLCLKSKRENRSTSNDYELPIGKYFLATVSVRRNLFRQYYKQFGNVRNSVRSDNEFTTR